jgi:hypothetical protein
MAGMIDETNDENATAATHTAETEHYDPVLIAYLALIVSLDS